MLVLSRKLNETIQIGTSLVRVVSIKRGQVRLGIEAAGDTTILRGELREQPAELINAGELAEVRNHNSWQKERGKK
jgi:carbon storage regulator CsrA